MQGLRAFRDLHQDGSISLYSVAFIAKDGSGKLSRCGTAGEGPEGTFFGLLTGSLIGVLGGPIGVAVGASTGTLIGAAFDLTRAGIAADFLEEVSEYLLPGTGRRHRGTRRGVAGADRQPDGDAGRTRVPAQSD
ncbi:MAG: DUF1269 domain-containing protein [Desulfobacterales bacterium]|nr:DUF1269 domain-containing protein [Desulfobacterales bacterium]